jgi:hypothetical protein
MAELLNRNWFDFDMRFPDAGSFPGAGKQPVVDDLAQPRSCSRASQPGKPA